MGMGFSSGNVKYVFTQAIPPSGVGEVEGSLWYDTTINTLYTYNGTSWLEVTGGAITHIETKDLTAGGVSTTTFSAIPEHRILVLKWWLEEDYDAGGDLTSALTLKFNGVSSANYQESILTSSTMSFTSGGTAFNIGNTSVSHTDSNDHPSSGNIQIFNAQGDAEQCSYYLGMVAGFSGTGLGRYGVYKVKGTTISSLVFASNRNFKGKISLFYVANMDG